MKFNVQTLGCRLNQAESDQIIEKMQSVGFVFTKDLFKAQIAIMNTCSVTNKADRESRKLARGIKKINKNIILIACGCSKVKISEIDHFVSNKDKVVDEIFRNFPDKEFKNIVEEKKLRLKTRANIKVQTGCNNYCTYCIVPYPRGRIDSVPVKSIINDINAKSQAGYKEVILSGINIGKYNYQKNRLADLIKDVLANTNILRIRISSINPEDISDKLLILFKDQRLCNHLHLSLQSGSDSVLKRMGRKYSTAQYKSIVTNIRQIDQYFGITSDAIVGFPGETDKEFDECLKFIADIEFLKVHIFKYSKRNGTVAARMNGQISPEIKKQRAYKLKRATDTSRENFLNKNIGRDYPILFESKKNKGEYIGYSPNYIRIKKSSKSKLTNTIKEVKINKENIKY